MPGYTEADYENSVIELFRNDLNYEYAYGPDIERDFHSPLYDEVLEDSLYSLNLTVLKKKTAGNKEKIREQRILSHRAEMPARPICA